MLDSHQNGADATLDKPDVDTVRLQQVLTDCGQAIRSLDEGLATLVNRLQQSLTDAEEAEAAGHRLQASAEAKFDEARTARNRRDDLYGELQRRLRTTAFDLHRYTASCVVVDHQQVRAGDDPAAGRAASADTSACTFRAPSRLRVAAAERSARRGRRSP